jgi:hypothetical protein
MTQTTLSILYGTQDTGLDPRPQALAADRVEEAMMAFRISSAWSTAVAVVLLLFGALLLDSAVVAFVAAVFLVAGLMLTSPEERYKGASVAALAAVVAFGAVVMMRLLD